MARTDMNERRPNGKTKRKKFVGPEADFYDNCKGKMIRISFQNGSTLQARLDWVDRFTIGVRDVSTGQKTMLFKKSIHSIERGSGDGTPTGATAD